MGLIDIGFGVFDYKARRDAGETKKEAGLGAGGKTAGGLIPFLVGMTLFPEPSSTIAGAVGLAILSIFGAMAGGKIGDEMSGLNAKKRGQKPDQMQMNSSVNLSDNWDKISFKVLLKKYQKFVPSLGKFSNILGNREPYLGRSKPNLTFCNR